MSRDNRGEPIADDEIMFFAIHHHRECDPCDPLTCWKSINSVANSVVRSITDPLAAYDGSEVVELSDENRDLL